ncbi:MAG: CoA transferase [Chloroflexi bacterium]|nr:CoA transferase [Chloroflexota bacterium]
MAGPLLGIRVLDLTQGVAGPYATKLLSDYGADVVKVERPDGGDPTRRIGPFPGDRPHPDRSGLFFELNSGKRSVTLNLATATGRRILQRLAADVDLVIESFRPGTLARLGLDAERLEAIQPGAALVQLSNYAQDGPYRDFELDDLGAYAMGGVLSLTGAEGREPARIGLYAPLFLAGGVLATYTIGAVFGSRRTGRGERVDASLMEILASSMDRGGPNLVAWQYAGGLSTTRSASQLRNAMPNGVFRCTDGYVSIAGQATFFPRMARMIERPDLAEDEAFLARLDDPDFLPEVEPLLTDWLAAHTKREAMERGQAEGLPISALNTMEDVFNDPHLHARDFFETVRQPAVGEVVMPGLPLRMSDTPGEVRSAPTLGQHTVEVLTGNLGYSTQDIAVLRQREIV